MTHQFSSKLIPRWAGRSVLLLCALLMVVSSEALAQKKKASAPQKPAAAAAGAREKHIVREAKSRKGDKSKIDFEGVDISGQRRTPFGSLVTNDQPTKNYDFVKLRYEWHDEMLQSARNLESGVR